MLNNTIYIPTNYKGLTFFKNRITYPGRSLDGLKMDFGIHFDQNEFDKLLKNDDIKSVNAQYVWKYSKYIVNVRSENQLIKSSLGNKKLYDFILINPLYGTIIPISDFQKNILDSINEVSSINEVYEKIEKLFVKSKIKYTKEKIFKTIENLEKKRLVRFSLNKNIEYHTDFIDGYYYDYEKRPIPHHQIRPVSYAYFYISLTENCHQMCTYCYYSENKHTHTPPMSISTLHKTIRFIRDMALLENRHKVHIAWWGGDAACEPELVINGIEYCNEIFKPLNIEISFSITSSFANEKSRILFDYINRYNMNVNLSNDGYRYLHNNHRKLLGENEATSFDLMNKSRFMLLANTYTFSEKFKKMTCPNTSPYEVNKIASNFKLRQNCNLKDEKELELYEDLCDFYDLFDVQYKLNLVTSSENKEIKKKWEQKILLYLKKSNVKLIQNFISGYSLLECKNIFLNMSSNPLDGLDFCFSKCGFGGGSLCINTLGDIYTCHRFCNNNDFKLGNIYDSPQVILKNGKQYHYRWLLKYEPCQTCENRSICSGGCAHEAYSYNGTIFSNAGCISLPIIFEKAKLVYLLGILYPNYDYNILSLQSNKNSRYEWLF